MLYYAFPVLAPDISHTTGWSLPAVTAGLSLGQIVAALARIPVGRWLDRIGPRAIMTTGSLLAVPALLSVTAATALAALAGLASTPRQPPTAGTPTP
ncbi:MAG: MFS transporter [Actinocatenispora sp.]